MPRNIKKKGFTLVELIVVIAILGILAAVAIPRLTGFQNSAKKKADIATAKTIATATTTLIADQRVTLPASSTTINITIDNTTTATAPTAASSDAATIAQYIRYDLQSVPKNKADTYSWFVTVDSNGTVSVYPGTSAVANDMLWPTIGTNYQ